MNRRVNSFDYYDMPELLTVSPAPHIKSLDTVTGIMLDVIIALIPAVIWSAVVIGIHALLTVLISVIVCVLSEFLFQTLTNKTVTVLDLSSVVTGLILGLSMPSNVALWIPAVGGVFAIIIVKQLFGGIGKNIVNPAIAARVFLMLCWPSQMSNFISPDISTAATPLVSLKSGAVPSQELFSIVAGNNIACIGEVSALAILIGFLYLIIRRVIHWQIPVTFVAVVLLTALLFPQTGVAGDSVLYHLFSGSLLFSAVFAAGDTVTTPSTKGGRLLFGAGCGIITVLIRYFGSYPDGTSFAILIMNLLVPFLESVTAPHIYGTRKSKAKRG